MTPKQELYNLFIEMYSDGLDEPTILLEFKKRYPEFVNTNELDILIKTCGGTDSNISSETLIPGLYVDIGHEQCLSVNDLIKMKEHRESYLKNNKWTNPFTRVPFSQKTLMDFDKLLESVGIQSDEHFTDSGFKFKKYRDLVHSVKPDLKKIIKALKRYSRDLKNDDYLNSELPSGGFLSDYIDDTVIPLITDNRQAFDKWLKIKSVVDYRIIGDLIEEDYDIYPDKERTRTAQRSIEF